MDTCRGKELVRCLLELETMGDLEKYKQKKVGLQLHSVFQALFLAKLFKSDLSFWARFAQLLSKS